MESVTSLVAEKTQAKGLEFLIHVDPEVPAFFLVGDSLPTGKVLINYANNPLKFTEKGEIEIQVSGGGENGNRGFGEVRGPRYGYRPYPEQIGRLFPSFQQADSSTIRKFGGTGLGLVLS